MCTLNRVGEIADPCRTPPAGQLAIDDKISPKFTRLHTTSMTKMIAT